MNKNNFILRVQNLTKTYQSGDRSLTVLRDVSFSLLKGDSCAIVGPSGSGKTTLLGLCAGLDRPTSGEVHLKGVRIDQRSEEHLARLRSESIGFVFQTFQLIPTLTALENVMVSGELAGREDSGSRAAQLLDRVGLAQRLDHYPVQLSGGEQQRVTLARAFINQPALLFADEPTGNLDSESGEQVEGLLFELNREAGTTLVLVTHDRDLAARAGRMITLKGGEIAGDTAQNDGLRSGRKVMNLLGHGAGKFRKP